MDNEMSPNLTIESVVRDWKEDDHLSRRKIAFLELAYERGLESVSESSSLETTEGKLGFPKDCYWLQVVACLLDHLKGSEPVSGDCCHSVGGGGFDREFVLDAQLVNYGHLTEEKYENWNESERLTIKLALGIS